MKLSTLLQSHFDVLQHINFPITKLCLDSRHVTPGSLFIALQGTQANGRQYIERAIAQGAVAVLIETDESQATIAWQDEVPLLPIKQLREKIGEIASVFYDHPSKKLQVIGVTGTNGKTSCTHFIAEIGMKLGIRVGVIGTLGYGEYGALIETGLTTPDAITLQSILHGFVQSGVQVVAMEVSSHSIDQKRIAGIFFEVGVFTNLTQDHLDYHGDMQTYAAVKKSFLTSAMVKKVVINIDDVYGDTWFTELADSKPTFAYSLQPYQPTKHIEPIFAKNIIQAKGLQADLTSPWGDAHLKVALVGLFNLSNALAVIGAWCVLNIGLQKVVHAFATVHAVPGRMQQAGGGDQPLVVVDYAHTPDALEKVLATLRSSVKGKLWCVFGCGGERDAGKRPKMAAIAEQYADHVIVTNDNPRQESPDAILADIMTGFKKPAQITVMLDRSKAIENSIQLANAFDCILIAGKGAEHDQQIGTEKYPFDDMLEVKRHLSHGK